MPSQKSIEQCLTWLKSKMAEKDIFDSINAELCYNVLLDQKARLNKLGVQFYNVQRINNAAITDKELSSNQKYYKQNHIKQENFLDDI